MQFCIKLDPRDTVKPLTPSQKATGIDVGLKFFLVDSEGNQVDCPNYYRKAEKQLNRLNRKKSKKYRKGKKQSRNYHKARGSSGFCVETRSILIEYPQNSPKSLAK